MEDVCARSGNVNATAGRGRESAVVFRSVKWAHILDRGCRDEKPTM